MTEHRINPLQWLSTKFASINHSHNEYLTSHQDISGKLDKAQTSHKGKNVIVDSSSGNITFEDKNNHTHPQYLTSHQNVSGKEDTSNKLTSLQSLNDLSTDTQYPSAKLVYTYWSDLNDTLQNNYPLSSDLGAVAFSNDYTDLDNLPSLGNLAFENDVDLSGHDLDELSDNTNLLFSGDYDDLDNKPTIPTATSDLVNDSGFLTSHQDITGKEDKSNKVTSISSSSTDTQYPSAKCVYDTANSKVEKDHKIVTTFSVSDYASLHNANWDDENTITMAQSTSYVDMNLRQALYDIGDYIEFTVTATNGTFGLYDSYDDLIYTGDTIKIIFEKITDSTCNGKMYHNTTLMNDYDYDISDSSLWFSSNNCTVNFNTKKYYHTVSLIDRIYPVGSIYMSVNDINPSLFIGGTWEQIEDRFLLGCGDTYTNGSTGGSADAVVVTHNHSTSETYVLTTSGSGVSRNSTAGTTGTKVSNLLQSADTVVRNIIGNTGTSGVGKNMPPYLAVYMWKRIA